jgi:NOL1/NOP2/fmu family ribosome biogenesis protein
MKIQILDNAKKKKFIEGIEDLGVKKIRELLIRVGNERIRAYSGNLSVDEIMGIWRILPIEGVGLYVGKDFVDRSGVREVRLSVDGMHVWKEQITEKILVLTAEQEVEWFKGKNVDLTEEQTSKFKDTKGFIAVKSSDSKDFVGTGKVGDGAKVLYGFLPKERRRKTSSI